MEKAPSTRWMMRHFAFPSMDGNTAAQKAHDFFMLTIVRPPTPGVFACFVAITRMTHVLIAFHLLHHFVPQPVRGLSESCCFGVFGSPLPSSHSLLPAQRL